MGLFGIFGRKHALDELVSQKRREEVKERERVEREAELEWRVLKEHEAAPHMEVPGYELPEGFPFSNREYVCRVPMRYDRESGEVFEEPHVYYADGPAVNGFKKDVEFLEEMLRPERIGISSLPTLKTEFSLVKTVSRPTSLDSLPDNSVRLTLKPLTPTGKNARYPATINFNAYEWVGSSQNGSHGSVSYLRDGSIGKADIHFWNRRVYFGARYKLINGKVAVNVLTYCDDPTAGSKVELYRAK